MSKALCGGIVLLVLACLVPADAAWSFWPRCCHRCRKPSGRCCCPGPQPCPSPVVSDPCFTPTPLLLPRTSLHPVVETHIAHQPVVTERDVTTTEYRTEAVREAVPTTRLQTVTVDEGSYQMVWVPKPTTRQVAHTVVEERVSFRSVPHTVTRRVQETATQAVQFQTVRYVPTTTYGVAGVPTAPLTAPVLSAFSAPIATPPGIASNPPPPTGPASVLEPSTPILARQSGEISPLPDPRFERTAARSTPDRLSRAYEDGPVAAEATRPSERRSSMFVPAPSAATVWRAQSAPTGR